MKTWSRSFTVVAAAAAGLAIAACSNNDNNNPSGPKNDTTAPTVASVSAGDSHHISVMFSEPVDRTTAEEEANFTITETGPATPVTVMNASLRSDGKTAMLTTADSMLTAGYSVTVNNVEDMNGNKVKSDTRKTFTGSSAPDQTPPEVVHHTPASNATNVNRNEPINVEFSEPLASGNFNTSLALTSNGVPVTVDITTGDDNHFNVKPTTALTAGTLYTVALIGIQDDAGNVMTSTEWSFHTASSSDHTPPHLVSSIPANNATNVATTSMLTLTFSEPVDTMSLIVGVTPTIGNIAPVWSSDNKTVTITPSGGLAANEQYSVIILPNGVKDLDGNGNTEPISILFTTGATLELGSISGTVTGDAASNSARDPSGATVLVASGNPFSGSSVTIQGATTVAANHTYTISHLPAGTYYPVVIMDSNGDKSMDPVTGDAIGMFGADFANGDTSPDSVVVTGAASTGITIPIYDPTAVTGQIEYSGVKSAGTYAVFVGLYSPTNFNPATSVPALATRTLWSGTGAYVINSLTVGTIASGNYAVGGFMDVNNNGLYDPAVDPFGVAGGNGNPTSLDLSGANDATGTLNLQDPGVASNLPAGVLRRWSTAKPPHSLAQWKEIGRRIALTSR